MRRPLHVEGQLALLVPESDWQPPTELPTLSGQLVAIDTETNDKSMQRDRGPGWVNRDGYILGVSVAWGDNSIYVPMRHPDTNNFDAQRVIRWVDDILRNNHCVFFNGAYDLGWLMAEGCTTWPQRMDDAQAQAVLIDENWDTYNLDDCCARVGIPGKDERLMKEAAAAYGVQPIHGSIKHGLWRLPARFVGPYAAQDAVATLDLYRAQAPVLKAEKTEGAYRTEIELMEVVYHMRRRGIRVNEDAAEQAQRRIRQERDSVLAAISTPPQWRRKATMDDVRSPDRLKDMFDAEGISYPITPKTKKPSITKGFLETLNHPMAKNIRRARQLNDLSDKFLGTYILEFVDRGRIHAEVHQLRDDEGGARTLRFSYSNPPMQQMPSRDAELAPIIRNVFEPEEGTDWLAADYKSQEPKLITHFAYQCREAAARYGFHMTGVEELVHYYCTDPNPDPHSWTAKILGRTRKQSKDLTQGLTYRMGPPKLSEHMNCSLEEAERMWTEFHEKIPYLQALSKFAEKRAKDHGYVRMIDGARRHFPLWQPKRNRVEGEMAREAVARQRWPGEILERAKAFQAANSVVQGSAARQMKRGMLAVYRAGILPLITMHDELGTPVTSPRDCEIVNEAMRDSVKLVMPVTCDLEVGKTWGQAKTEYREWFGVAA